MGTGVLFEAVEGTARINQVMFKVGYITILFKDRGESFICIIVATYDSYNMLNRGRCGSKERPASKAVRNQECPFHVGEALLSCRELTDVSFGGSCKRQRV